MVAMIGAGIAGQCVCCSPYFFACKLVEGHYPGAVAFDLALYGINIGRSIGRAAAYVGDKQVAPDYRCAADTKKVLHDTEFFFGIDPPDQLAIFEPNALQDSFSPKTINPIAINHWRAAGAVVVVQQVGVIAGMLDAPKFFAGFAFAAGEPNAICVAIEVHQAATADRGCAVAGA